MHVVVVGCGRVGSSLALSLTSSGHTVAVVDRRSEAFTRLGPAFTGTTVDGIGFDRDTLREAGIEEAGAVASVTNGDNSNILIARVARETFSVERVVARIYDPRRAVIYQRLGIPTVATVAWATERVLGASCPTSPGSTGSTRARRSCSSSGSCPGPGAGTPSKSWRSPASPRWCRSGATAPRRCPNPARSCRRATSSTLRPPATRIAQLDAHLVGPTKGGH